MQVLRSALSNFEYFTKEQFDKPRLAVLQDLMKEYKENRDTRAPIVLMNQFKDWMAEYLVKNLTHNMLNFVHQNITQ